MIHTPPWYRYVQDRLEPSWSLQVGIAAAIIVVTLFLLYRRDPVPMALWLTYLILP